MKKKYKFLKEFMGKKVGDVIEFDDAEAKGLLDGKIVELVVEEPDPKQKAVSDALNDLREGLSDIVVNVVKETVKSIKISGGKTAEVIVGKERAEDDPTGGFKCAGEFYQVVKRCTQPGAPINDDRIKVLMGIDKKAASGQNESNAEDGGILVPVTFAQGIWERPGTDQLNDLMALIDGPYPINGNTWAISRLKGDSRAAGSRFGGARAYWVEEGDQLTGSKIGFDRMGMRLKKVAGIVFMTDEQMEDSPMALEQYLNKQLGSELRFVINQAIFEGNGATQPLGIMKHANSLITVAKESGQTAGTIVTRNINKMWSRAYGPLRSRMVWLVNQDVEPQLEELAFPSIGDATKGVAAQVPMYMPAGGITDAPYARLKGRPVIPCEFCETLGTVGDIVLVDLSQYMMIGKSSGIKTAVSIHLRFDYEEVAYRASVRVDGQPSWPTALTPLKGSTNTLSYAVALATRS